MKNKIVVISQPRTGTSLLVNTLNSLNGFNVYGELFVISKNMGFVYTEPHQQKEIQKQLERFLKNCYDNSGKSVNVFLDDLYSKSDDVIGFKLLYHHLKRPFGKQIIDYIQSHNIFKIIMYRENKIKQYISGITNRKEGKVVVDVANIEKMLNRLIEQDKELFSIFENKEHIKISYEQLTGGKNVEKLDLSWLDKSLGEVDVKIKKYRPNTIKDNVENYSEFYDAIKGTKFEKWL